MFPKRLTRSASLFMSWSNWESILARCQDFRLKIENNQDNLGVTSRYLGIPSIEKPSERKGLPDLKACLTGLHFQGNVLLLLKHVTIVRTFGCGACARYTLFKLGVIMIILGFVYFYSSVTYLAQCSLNQ